MEVEGADPSVAASWFRGKVDFPVRVPRLDLQNASFDGARLSHVRDHQAAHMVYTVDGHRVTLMIFSTDDIAIRGGDLVHVEGRDVVLGRRKGFNVAVMLDGDMAYAFSSDLPRGRLLDIVRSFAR
jgi:anti-sigma factor RsiW